MLGVKQQKNTLKLDPTLADMFSLDLSFALGFSCYEARLEGGKQQSSLIGDGIHQSARDSRPSQGAQSL